MSSVTTVASTEDGAQTSNAGLVVGIIAAIVVALLLVAGVVWCLHRYKNKRQPGRNLLICSPGWWKEVCGSKRAQSQNEDGEVRNRAPTSDETNTLQLRNQPDVAELNPYQYDAIPFSSLTEIVAPAHSGDPLSADAYNVYAQKETPLPARDSLAEGEEEAFRSTSAAHRTPSYNNNNPGRHQRVVSMAGVANNSSLTAINHQRLISGISTAGPTSVSHSRSTSNIPQPHLVAVSPQQLLLLSSNSSLSQLQSHHLRQLSYNAVPLATNSNTVHNNSISTPTTLQGMNNASRGGGAVYHERMYSHLSISSQANQSNGNPRPPTSYDVSDAPLGNYVS